MTSPIRSAQNLQLSLITALLVVLAARATRASENDAAHYPTGTNTIEPAMMPAPGDSLWLNYITYYTADRSNNSNGDAAVPGYLVSTVAEAARLLHAWTSIDGVAWTSGIVLIANDTDLHVPHRYGSGGGLGDLVIQPVLLTAAFGNLHVLGGFDVSLPTGNYSKDKLVNPGLNYTTAAPQVALTWLPTKEFEFSLFSIAGFNSKNPNPLYIRRLHLHRLFGGLSPGSIIAQATVQPGWLLVRAIYRRHAQRKPIPRRAPKQSICGWAAGSLSVLQGRSRAQMAARDIGGEPAGR